MILILGGPSRSGKTMLSRRLLKECGIPYFCLDVMVMGLTLGIPDLHIEPEAPYIPKAEKLWPFVKVMCETILDSQMDVQVSSPAEPYCLEGDLFLPKHAGELQQAFPGWVKSCFLGYADVDPFDKLTQIRSIGGGMNDWLKNFPDDYVLSLIKESIEFSIYLRDECRRLEIPYYDVSSDFMMGVNQAFQHLR
jgi:hypothetical protein